jgi:hypothetical protein
MGQSEKQGYEQNETYQIPLDANTPISWGQIRQALIDWARKISPTGIDSEYSQTRHENSDASASKTLNSDAEFIGWQQSRTGQPYALYNVTAEQHPLYRSTVSEKTLRKHDLKIPQTPLPGGNVRRIDHEE